MADGWTMSLLPDITQTPAWTAANVELTEMKIFDLQTGS